MLTRPCNSLGIAYNALPGQNQKDEFEDWAKEEYPEIWARLVTKGRKKTVEGMDKFNLVRDIKA